MQAIGISQWTLFQLPLFACSLLTAALSVIAYRYRHRSNTVPLLVLLVGATIWTVTYGLQIGQTELGAKLVWSRLTYVGVFSVPVSLFVFVLRYTGRGNLLSRARLLALCSFPVTVLAIVMVTPEVVMPHPDVTREHGIALLDFEEANPWWVSLLAYTYTLNTVSVLLVALEFVQSFRVGRFRGQTLSILLGICVPFAMDMVAQLSGLNVSLAPIGLSIAATFISIAVFRYQLFDISPVARRTVIEDMESGFLVVGHRGRIIDTNEAATELFSESLLDKEASEVVPQLGQPDGAVWSAAAVPDEITLHDEDAGQRIYEIDATEQYDDRGDQISVALVFREVTDKRERKRELREQKDRLKRKTDQLEAQNERLDDFASLLSHDIRNPLGVAKGYLDLLEVDDQQEHLDTVADSLDRIEQLVDEALQLAKEGHSVTETETLRLSGVVQEAWSNVDTTSASLEDEVTDRRVDADPARLQRLFENLFRNAIEHGTTGEPATVTITVGDNQDGFYIADDGPGIPKAERGQIFEKGYTTAENGTGFGLAIVDTIVSAHGWTVTIEESDSGGAAFVIET